MRRSLLMALLVAATASCVSQPHNRPGKEPEAVRELRPRLELLQVGMSLDEVSRILGVTPFPAGGTMNYWHYVYPSPFDPEHRYSLSFDFDTRGTKVLLRRATLNLYETWPK